MSEQSTPYASYALRYLDGGLGYPTPSMYPYTKKPPLGQWTGANGRIPDWEQVSTWTEQYHDSNIFLRLAPDVIGIDIDQYDDKHGEQTILDIADRHGRLPPTHVSTARDLPSGIHFYRLRSWMETSKMRDPGEHVEVIRFEHRYAVVPPSWHPGVRARYVWSQEFMPQKGDLGFLPSEWYVHLVRSCGCFEEERAERRQMMQRLYNRPSGEAGAEAARRDLAQAAETLTLTDAGSRNNTLSSIAGRFLLYDVVMNNILSLDEVTYSLMGAARVAGLDKREAQRTILSAIEWATREGTTE